MQLNYRSICYEVTSSAQSVPSQPSLSAPITLTYRGNAYQAIAVGRSIAMNQSHQRHGFATAGVQLSYRGITYCI